MGKIWEHNLLYSIFRKQVDLGTLTSFSSVRVEGRENLPAEGEIILAPNHCCTLMDALAVLMLSPRPTAFGARADIFKNKTAAKILRFLRIVPLARERDGKEALAQNYNIFSEVVDCLENGVPFCLFPEGRHRPARELQPIKKGIFRICDLAVSRTDKPVHIVPIGLNYQNPFEFKRKLLIRIGKAIDYRQVRELDAANRLSLLSERMQSLLDREDPPVKQMNGALRTLLAIVFLPLFIICAILASPILLLTVFFSRNTRDRAWMNTIRYGCKLLFPIHWPFHSGFYAILNFYNSLLIDIKK